MIRYLRFDMGHLDFFKPRDDFEDIQRDMQDNMSNPMMDMVTVVHNNQILCISGCTELRAGVGEVWLLVDEAFKYHRIRFVRAVKTLMEEYLVKERRFYRLQMAIDASINERQRWAEYLGFEKEGLMKAYDTLRNDHYLYARVF
jgi:hypothetical protein